MEQKPNKKEELMLANNVLKLAADLLKVRLCSFFLVSFPGVRKLNFPRVMYDVFWFPSFDGR